MPNEAVEFRAVRLDGSEVWISATGVRTEYQGRPAGLVSIRDITEQRKAENRPPGIAEEAAVHL